MNSPEHMAGSKLPL